jgi:hypothetical protein
MGDGSGEPRTIVVLVVAEREFTLRVIDATIRCDLALIDELLRLRLGGARSGWSIRLTHVDEHLRALIELVGLTECLGL